MKSSLRKTVSVLLCVCVLFGALGVSAFAVTYREADAALEDAHDLFFGLGDVNGDGDITAADARLTLRKSAQLADSAFIRPDNADYDGDGTVTAIDARAILRLSAGLDDRNAYISDATKLQLFNAALNDLKPSRGSSTPGKVKYWYGVEDTAASVNIQNEKALKSLSDQMNRLSTGEDVDLVAEMKNSTGTHYITNGSKDTPDDITYYTYVNANKYIPLKSRAESSFLTTADVSSVTYRPNQSYTFRLKDDTTDYGSKTVTGTDAITVALPAETLNINTYPDSQDQMIASTHAGKVFDLPEKTTLTAAYAQLAELQEEMRDMLEGQNVVNFQMDPTFKNLNVKATTYVTVYLDHETGKPVAADYYLVYDFVVDLYIDVRMVVITVKDQHVTITNTQINRTSLYFDWSGVKN